MVPVVCLLFFSSKGSMVKIFSLMGLFTVFTFKVFMAAGPLYVSLGASLSFSSASSILMGMSFWLTIFTLTSGVVMMKKASKIFESLSIIMLAVVLMAFSTSCFISFYFLFESSLIPVLLMIMFWGYQPERLQAINYMIFYTLTASIPLLILLLLVKEANSSSMMTIGNVWPKMLSNHFLSVMAVTAFLVKCPMYSLHFWLPKAHVEAPTVGSMILAGILLKLGGYGLVKMFYVVNISNLVSASLFLAGFVGALIAAFMMIIQNDLKVYIALSSVHHMGLVVGAVASAHGLGMVSALVVMLSHGLISSLMFMFSGALYEKWSTRNMYLMKGAKVLYPMMSLMFFSCCVCNMGVPPSVTLLGEVFSLAVFMATSSFTAISVVVSSMLITVSCVYNTLLGAALMHGQSALSLKKSSPDLPFSLVVVVFSLLSPTLLMILSPTAVMFE